jgi:hypothetical protein
MANSHWQAAGSPFKQHELITISRYVAILHMNGIYSNMANGQQHYFDALAAISNRLRFVLSLHGLKHGKWRKIRSLQGTLTLCMV